MIPLFVRRAAWSTRLFLRRVRRRIHFRHKKKDYTGYDLDGCLRCDLCGKVLFYDWTGYKPLLWKNDKELTTMNTRPNGFSLIELLIVVAIIAIIAAITIPNLLASKRTANEASAQSSVRTIYSAEVTFQATTGDGVYGSLVELTNERLIDSVLGAGAKSGYDFAVVESSGSGALAVFGAYGFPSRSTGIGQTGTRRFALTEIGVLRGDGDLSARPSTRAAIWAMPALP